MIGPGRRPSRLDARRVRRAPQGDGTKGSTHGRPDAAARGDRGGRQDLDLVQIGRRCRQAGRQPVRDRDRQGVDGSAVDQRRRAGGDPRAGGRRGAGRRHRRGDLRSGRRRPRARKPPPTGAPPKTPDVAAACAGSGRGDSSGCATSGDADRARPVPRGAHAGAQLSARRNCRAVPSRRRSHVGSPARPASISRRVHGLGTARPHRRARRAGGARRRGRPQRLSSARGADRRAGQGALPGRAVRGAAARQHAPHHRGRWCRRRRRSRISI